MTAALEGQPVLLLGASGMLGRAWSALLNARGFTYDAPSHAQLDITDENAVGDAINTPRLVINCAAWTDVDGAETQEDAASLVNGNAPAALARACAQSGAMLIHYSTDYVFPGHADAPYRTDTPIDPINAYGRTKAVGEIAIAQSGCPHLIIRTSWLYAPWGKNFVRTIAKAARDKPALTIVNDQRGRPTSCTHLADASLRLLDAGARGTHHITDGGDGTWFDLAAAVVEDLHLDCAVSPCSSDAYPRPARRPAYSVLDLAETENLIGPLTDWRTNLRAVLDRLEPSP